MCFKYELVVLVIKYRTSENYPNNLMFVSKFPLSFCSLLETPSRVKGIDLLAPCTSAASNTILNFCVLSYPSFYAILLWRMMHDFKSVTIYSNKYIRHGLIRIKSCLKNKAKALFTDFLAYGCFCPCSSYFWDFPGKREILKI